MRLAEPGGEGAHAFSREVDPLVVQELKAGLAQEEAPGLQGADGGDAETRVAAAVMRFVVQPVDGDVSLGHRPQGSVLGWGQGRGWWSGVMCCWRSS